MCGSAACLLQARPDAISYSGAIAACGRAQKWQQALKLLSLAEQRGVPLDAMAYNATITACERSGEWQEALDVLPRMRRKGQRPTIITYSACIAACANGQPSQWQTALDLLAEMGREGCPPNSQTYSSAISACGRGGQPRHALALVPSPARTARAAPPLLLPRYSCATAALFYCCRCICRVRSATALPLPLLTAGASRVPPSQLDEMSDRGLAIDRVCYIAAISACDGTRHARALQLLREMARSGQAPDSGSYHAVMQSVRAASRATAARTRALAVHPRAPSAIVLDPRFSAIGSAHLPCARTVCRRARVAADLCGGRVRHRL